MKPCVINLKWQYSMEFRSQICTTPEQSRRLLNAGLSPKTADLKRTHLYLKGESHIVISENSLPLLSQEEPGWSLHRLIEISGTSVECRGLFLRLCGTFYCDNKDDVYECLVGTIEELIASGMLNNKYLNKNI